MLAGMRKGDDGEVKNDKSEGEGRMGVDGRGGKGEEVWFSFISLWSSILLLVLWLELLLLW